MKIPVPRSLPVGKLHLKTFFLMPHCQIGAVKDHQTFEASSNWKEVKARKQKKKKRLFRKTIQGAKEKKSRNKRKSSH